MESRSASWVLYLDAVCSQHCLTSINHSAMGCSSANIHSTDARTGVDDAPGCCLPLASPRLWDDINTPPSQVCAFTCVFVTVANAALPRDRSTVNGLGQAGVSLVRAVMPPLSTALFALSVRSPDAPWPANWHAVWLLLAASMVGLLLLSLRLPPWIESKRKGTD